MATTRFLLLLALAVLPLTSCVSDPEDDPRAAGPRSSSRQTPWNEPVAGQGGGAFGALPQIPRR